MKAESEKFEYILGLDLGVASVGWAVVPCDLTKISVETLKMGSRVFKAGSTIDKTGKVKSPNEARRMARGARRNNWRQRRRIVKLFNILQKEGLLPPKACHSPMKRQIFFNELDADLKRRYFPNADHVTAQTFLYKLRAMALYQELDLDAVGRIFYMLSQRRGFLSNKKTDLNLSDTESEANSGSGKARSKKSKVKKEETGEADLGKVKGDIKKIDDAMKETGSATIGEYFSTLNPEEIDSRIRTRYTSRQQYKDEFELIWKKQREFRPDVYTGSLHKRIARCIYSQRRLKSQKSLVAKCELEPQRRCIVKGDPLFQEFRYWQKVLDLRVFDPDFERARRLTPEERKKLLAVLENSEKMEFDKIREALGFPKRDGKNWKFNLELDSKGADRFILGNRTRTKIRKTLEKTGAPQLPDEDIDRIASEILFYDLSSALAVKIQQLYPAFSEETSKKIADISLEPDYANLSRKAIKKILRYMQDNLMTDEELDYEKARSAIYRRKATETVDDILKPVAKALGDIRNPTVVRTLTEMRKVVNAIIRRYGKPELIRVELARELKKGSKAREEIFEANKKNEKERKDAESAIRDLLQDKGYPVTGRDILKYRLAEECNWRCPYTGDRITPHQLFGPDANFNIEHIIPISISLDDSFANKTLCAARVNQQVKRNQTPFECFGDKPEWADVLGRVEDFKGKFKNRKLALFKLEDFSDYNDLPSRLLNDTRYISRLAREYLGTLYGADSDGVDSAGTTRVQIALGATTSWLRNALDLNTILPKFNNEDGGQEGLEKTGDVRKKNRDDYRHHAVDALVIALTDANIIKYMSHYASECYDHRGRFLPRYFKYLTNECPYFRAIVKEVVDGIVVSHRVSRKVSGAMHKETIYGKISAVNNAHFHVVRKPLSKLTKEDIPNICDRQIRNTVESKLEALDNGLDKLRKIFASEPLFIDSDSFSQRKVPIKSVRVKVSGNAKRIGKSAHRRYVKTGDNHHMEIYAVLDDQGNEKRWETRVVSLLEAYRRVSRKEPVIQREFGPKTRFICSLSLNEAVKLNDGRIYRVIGIAEDELTLGLNYDARSRDEARKGNRLRLGTLQKRGVVKLYVSILGGKPRRSKD